MHAGNTVHPQVNLSQEEEDEEEEVFTIAPVRSLVLVQPTPYDLVLI